MKILALDIVELKDFPGYYIDCSGNVFSTRGRGHKLKPRKWVINNDGYAVLNLRKDGGQVKASIHRLVASAFLDNPKDTSYQINHKDGNKNNNHFSNLEWISQRENLYHAMNIGLHVNPMKPVVGINPKTGSGIWLRSQAEARSLGFHQPNINKCLKGLRQSSGGYNWSYA